MDDCLYKGSESPDDGTYDSNQFRVCNPDRSNLLAGRSEKWQCGWYIFVKSYVYIIITPIITVTMTKMMYAGENVMIVEDALNRIDGLLEKNRFHSL